MQDKSVGSINISLEESTRISILKVWLSIMVVLIHAYENNITFVGETISYNIPMWLDNIKYIISQVLSRSAVPAFFFLSSYFLYSKKYQWKRNIKKKTRSLLTPYLIINLFWILFYYVAQHIPTISTFFSKPENIVANWNIGDWIQRFCGSPNNMHPMVPPLWFIRDLFVLNILSVIFDWLVNKTKYISVYVFIILWLALESTHIFFMDIQSLCFWGLGCYFAKQQKSMSFFDRYKTLIGLSYLTLVICVFLLRGKSNFGPMAIRRLCYLIGVPFWFVFATNIRGKIRRIILWISKYSFCIFLFHELCLTILQKITVKIFPHTTFSLHSFTLVLQ